MFTLYLDRGTNNERSIKLQSYYERPINNSFTGSYVIEVDKESDIPSIDGFATNMLFKTVDAFTSDGLRLPISGHYNTISDFTCNYDDKTRRFGINLTLGLYLEAGNVEE